MAFLFALRAADIGFSGPVRSGAVKIYVGFVGLVAGSAVDAVPASSDISPGAEVFLNRRAAAGTPGHLTGAWAGGNVTVTSSSGTDTSTVVYALIDRG